QQMNPDDGVKIQFCLDGNLFNLRRLQTQRKTEIAHFLELQYADDCAILAHSPEALQRSLTNISNIYQAMGLRINVNKTEIISQRNNPAGPLAFRINGE
ncbi:reverse transcriptase domain-containing protein, partial [Klebsiella pneumoniae]|uniref:reverse transcriptase domain-containing protein n=1 Tax=Klebsiella pneumoniae TaxID=573 RepID=UPI003EC0A50F